MDNNFILHGVIKYLLNSHNNLYAACAGFTKAFDYIVWDVIWYKLITLRISGKLLDYKLYRFLTVYMGSLGK